MTTNWHDVSFGDIQMIRELASQNSLRSWANLNRLSPVKASRLLQSLETKLGCKLVLRNVKGITLTREGERIAFLAKGVDQIIGNFDAAILENIPEVFEQTLVIASRGFLNVRIAADMAEYCAGQGVNLDVIDLSPSELLEAMKRDVVDLIVTIGSIDIGRAWVQKPIGKMNWGLFVRPRHPLSADVVTKKELERYRLGHHCFWDGRRIVSTHGEMHGVTQVKQLGFGAETVFTAIEMATSTDQVVCIPRISAMQAIAQGRLVELEVRGIKTQTSELFLVAHSERVKQRMLNDILTRLKSLIE